MVLAIMYLRKAQAECKIGRGLEGVVSETIDEALKCLQDSLKDNYQLSLSHLCGAKWSTIKQAIELSYKPIEKRVTKKKTVSRFKKRRTS